MCFIAVNGRGLDSVAARAARTDPGLVLYILMQELLGISPVKVSRYFGTPIATICTYVFFVTQFTF